jgi:hypothetical protein
MQKHEMMDKIIQYQMGEITTSGVAKVLDEYTAALHQQHSVGCSFTKEDLQCAFSAGVQIGVDYGEDGENSVQDDFNKWFIVIFGDK